MSIFDLKLRAAHVPITAASSVAALQTAVLGYVLWKAAHRSCEVAPTLF